jgi:hypothetical protein
MMPFRNFSESVDREGLPVVETQPDTPPLDAKQRAEINGDLADVTGDTYRWPLAGLEEIREVLGEYGLLLPDINLDEDSDEKVFMIRHDGEDLFLYVFYHTDEDKTVEFHAELVNEKELHNLLDDLNDDTDNDEAEDDESRPK